MKRYFLSALMVAGITVAALPVMAQSAKKEKDKDNKGKEVQTIVITRTGNTDEKTVIEVVGDNITVNGKKPGKNDDVKVNVHSYTRPQTYNRVSGFGQEPFIYNQDPGTAFSLFAEDSNRAMLGVYTDMNDKGAEVVSVNKESAAEKAGLKKGDIITQIGEKKIEDAEDVHDAVQAHKPGDKVAIKVLRDGKEQTVTAELGRYKGFKMSQIAPSKIQMEPMDFYNTNPGMGLSSPALRGLLERESAPKLGISIQDTEDGKGVKVIEVDEDSNGAKAGLKKDDVITHVCDAEVNSAEEVSRMVREGRNKSTLKFKVLRNGKTETVEVKVPRKLKTAEL